MLVYQKSVTPVSAQFSVSTLHIPASVEVTSFEKSSNTHFSTETIKKMAINGSIKTWYSSKIFSVQFIYLQKVMSTKVLKVSACYDNPFYKVVLTTLLHNSASFWWIQLQLNGWVTLLGPELNEKMKYAIISAIECHELLMIG